MKQTLLTMEEIIKALDLTLQTLDGEPVPILRKTVPQKTDSMELDNFTEPYQ